MAAVRGLPHPILLVSFSSHPIVSIAVSLTSHNLGRHEDKTVRSHATPQTLNVRESTRMQPLEQLRRSKAMSEKR